MAGQPSKEPSSRRRLSSAATRSRPPKSRGFDPGALQGEDRAGEVAAALELVDSVAQEGDRRRCRRWRRRAGCARRPRGRASPSRSSRSLERIAGVGAPAAVFVLRPRPASGAAGPARAEAGAGAGRARRPSRAPAPASDRARDARRAADRRHSKRSRKRTSILIIAGPAMRAKDDVADRVGGVEGHGARLQDEEVLAGEVSSICCHQREVEQGAVGRRRRVRRPRRGSAGRRCGRRAPAPRRACRRAPRPAICHGVQGPCPNQKLETSAGRGRRPRSRAPGPARSRRR